MDTTPSTTAVTMSVNTELRSSNGMTESETVVSKAKPISSGVQGSDDDSTTSTSNATNTTAITPLQASEQSPMGTSATHPSLRSLHSTVVQNEGNIFLSDVSITFASSYTMDFGSAVYLEIRSNHFVAFSNKVAPVLTHGSAKVRWSGGWTIPVLPTPSLTPVESASTPPLKPTATRRAGSPSNSFPAMCKLELKVYRALYPTRPLIATSFNVNIERPSSGRSNPIVSAAPAPSPASVLQQQLRADFGFGTLTASAKVIPPNAPVTPTIPAAASTSPVGTATPTSTEPKKRKSLYQRLFPAVLLRLRRSARSSANPMGCVSGLPCGSSSSSLSSPAAAV